MKYVKPEFSLGEGGPMMHCPECRCRMHPVKGWSLEGARGYWLWFSCENDHDHISRAFEISPPAYPHVGVEAVAVPGVQVQVTMTSGFPSP